jgi:adenylate cyclase class IV
MGGHRRGDYRGSKYPCSGAHGAAGQKIVGEHTIEVELRYKVHNPEATIQKLGELGIAKTGQKHLIDQWFMPKDIHSQAEEEDWFDNNKGVAWRIRRTEQNDGTFSVEVTSKQLTDANNHDTFLEGDAHITDYDLALAFVAEKGYRCWLTIDKTRYEFASGHSEYEIVLDVIAGLAEKIGVGAALEVEFKGEATREEALAKLDAFVAKAGINPGERFERSLTVEAMSALADFGEK